MSRAAIIVGGVAALAVGALAYGRCAKGPSRASSERAPTETTRPDRANRGSLTEHPAAHHDTVSGREVPEKHPAAIVPENAIMHAAGAGIADPFEERAALVDALLESGPPETEWAREGNLRMDAVSALATSEEHVAVEHLGCFRAGCGAKIVFMDRTAEDRFSRYIEAANMDNWPHGIVMTAPQRLPNGHADSYLFIASPP